MVSIIRIYHDARSSDCQTTCGCVLEGRYLYLNWLHGANSLFFTEAEGLCRYSVEPDIVPCLG